MEEINSSSVNEEKSLGDVPADLKAEQGWQSIETAPKGYDVLMFRVGGYWFIDDWGRYEKYNNPGFTHWMPLPDPPEVSE